jgi:outer membrane receptor protein involved in Fe transport
VDIMNKVRILAAAALTAAAITLAAAPAQAAPIGPSLCGTPNHIGRFIGEIISITATGQQINAQNNPGSSAGTAVPIVRQVCSPVEGF